MESANLHYKNQRQQQQQQQLVDHESSPPFASPSFYEVGTTRAASNWTPNSILNDGDFNQNINTTSMIHQDMGFGSFSSLTAHELQLARIKEELSSSSSSASNHSYHTKFTEMLKSPSSISSIEDSHLLHPHDHHSSSSTTYMKNNDQQISSRDLLKTFSSECQINGLHHLPSAAGGFYSNINPHQKYCPIRGTFSQIFPTINISNLNQSSSSSTASSLGISSSSLDMNLEALDLFNSTRISGSLSNPFSHNQLGLLKSSLPAYGLGNMQQQPCKRSSNSTPTTNVSPFNNGAPEVKRSSSFLETNKAPQATPKKSRLDSRSSCQPFKVRKEKLGDRIAALQQLVAPFGKTDTASVLMEAIGYIKFLQNQVETLSVPYMKSSHNKTRKMQGDIGEDGHEETTRDLKSRGLCLVPLSCLSYVTDGGGGVWPPSPNFGGAAT